MGRGGGGNRLVKGRIYCPLVATYVEKAGTYTFYKFISYEESQSAYTDGGDSQKNLKESHES